MAELGHTYISFALGNHALVDLMFRPSELHPAEPELARAQRDAIGVLHAAVASAAPPEGSRLAPATSP
jgi:hypothetical protein